MSEQAQLLPTPRHLNNGLFSNDYLLTVFAALERDPALVGEARAVLDALRTLRAQIRPDTLEEGQLEERWVRPILRALDHHFAVQVKIRYREHGYRKPDYLFLRAESDAGTITSETYQPAEIAHALAVGDAKRWGVNLDQTPRSATHEGNPSQQIDEYLRYSELPWGILTDGRYWRLYGRETSKYNRYYAVDLDWLLENNDANAFLAFYAFFRREAFASGWLNNVLAGSEDFAQKLTDRLEGEVYDALELIAQGFLDFRRNRLTATSDTLREIYEQSLVLLYRLLFIFYAESREILPLNANRLYTTQHSLNAIKRDVRTAIDFNHALNPDSSATYSRLRDLFFAIDAGDSRLDIPAYNGRLFSDEEHPFLRDHVVGDLHLVPALDKLARVEALDGSRGLKRVFVDYRDLEVRHLGSIYEKLLEYELAAADTPLALKGGEYIPAGAGEKPLKEVGQVYLKTGSNQRKVTGSYYTPDYIVRFIVEKTLEPLLTEITARHADLDEQGDWRVRPGAEAALRDAILGLNVLDPATGSGHFIADVTAYIAEWLRGLRLRPADLGDEDELIYWKRLVAGVCVYALDINPLAVELAKLSMWLTTLAKGRPLSFLDHHLRVGNSLIGARLDEITDKVGEQKRRQRQATAEAKAAAAGQAAMFTDDAFTEGVRFAVAQMAQIEGTRAANVGDVKEQERLYAALRGRLARWEKAADVWTARAFGLELDAGQWEAVRKVTSAGQSIPAIDRIVDNAQAIAGRKELRFFHWELLFPEIFFDADGKRKPEPGFDAVVGNPPYVRYQNFGINLKKYFESHFQGYDSSADLFLYFFEQGIRSLKSERRLGFITSGTYMNSSGAKEFRQFISQAAAFDTFVDFGEIQPFRGVDLPTNVTVAILTKSKERKIFRTLLLQGRRAPESLAKAMSEYGFDTLPDITAADEWRFQPKAMSLLFQKVMLNRSPLLEAVDRHIYYGILTGRNEAFYVDEQTRQKLIQEHVSSLEILKPILRGQHLRSWYQMDFSDYVIFARQGIDIEKYPAVKEHLNRYRESLEPRPENWKGSWNGRTSGNYKWYEWHDSVAYHTEFLKPKILGPDIAKFPRFSWDASGQYCNDKGFFIVPSSISLLAILNSRLTWFVLSQIATPLAIRQGLWRYQAKIQFVERLPIPELTADQESRLAEYAEQITALARGRYTLHESMRRRISTDLAGGGKLNTALEEWWTLEAGDFNAEIKKAFKRPIPLAERDEWERYISDQKAKHAALTSQIVTLETALNAVVYQAFNLTPEEIHLIERTTKYPYGAV
jgi:type I restriction-modification system DNA methylase subunit